MGLQNRNFVIIFNIWTIVVVTLQSYVLGNFFHSMSLIHNPLFVTETCLISFTLWHMMGFHALQEFYKISLGNLLKTSAWAVMSSAIFHVMIVIYGIPLVDTSSETYHLACLLTVLVVVPNLCVIGTSMEGWLRLYTSNKTETLVETSVQTTTVCTIVGCWLGAIPIPLDWDTPWQVWPVSCLIGCIAGYVVGLAVACERVQKRDANNKKVKLG